MTKLGPTRHYVGEIAKFRIVIKNTGNFPVTNLEVVDHYNSCARAAFDRFGPRDAAERRFAAARLPRLEKGERREINVQCACVSPSQSACSLVTVTADGDLRYADEKCVEISAARRDAAGTTGGIAPPPALPAETLKLTLRTSANPARVGGPAHAVGVPRKPQPADAARGGTPHSIAERNHAQYVAQILPPGAFEIVGQLEVRFNNVGTINPGERRDFDNSAERKLAGVVTFVAQVIAAGMAQPIVYESNPIQI